MTDTIAVTVELDADTVAALGICQHFAGDPPGAHAEAAAMIERTLVNECIRRSERLGLDPASWPRSPVLVDYPAPAADNADLRVRARAGEGAEEVDGAPVYAFAGWLVDDEGQVWGGHVRAPELISSVKLDDHELADADGMVRMDAVARFIEVLNRESERVVRTVARKTGRSDLTRADLDWRLVTGPVTAESLGIRPTQEV